MIYEYEFKIWYLTDELNDTMFKHNVVLQLRLFDDKLFEMNLTEEHFNQFREKLKEVGLKCYDIERRPHNNGRWEAIH